MKIEDTELPDEIRRGRPIIYPFADILPAQKLTIPGNEDLPAHRLSVHNAFNYFKKSNALEWTASVRIEGNNIVIYRLT